jgi:hypothetical protein
MPPTSPRGARRRTDESAGLGPLPWGEEGTPARPGDVRQVRPAQVRVVQDHDVAGAERGEGHAATLWHGAEVHRNVRRLGDEAAAGIEDGAGVVAALFDIRRMRGAAKRHAHLVRHGREQRAGDAQFSRVYVGVHGWAQISTEGRLPQIGADLRFRVGVGVVRN